jgi:hypothetical protein
MIDFEEYCKNSLLLEYNQAIIVMLIEKFKKERKNLTDQQIYYYINRFDQVRNSPRFVEIVSATYPAITNPKDILQFTFRQIESIVDQFPQREKQTPTPQNNLSQEDPYKDLQLVSSANGLKIYHATSQQGCIAINKGIFDRTYNFCVSTSSAGNLYNNYRFSGKGYSFYFVYDPSLNKANILHLLVLQISPSGKIIFTTAANTGNSQISWKELLKMQPKLKGLESVFSFHPYTREEKIIKAIESRSPTQFGRLSYDDKKMYIQLGGEINVINYRALPGELKLVYINHLPFTKRLKENIVNWIKQHEPNNWARLQELLHLEEFKNLSQIGILRKLKFFNNPCFAKLAYRNLGINPITIKLGRSTVINDQCCLIFPYKDAEQLLSTVTQNNLNKIQERFKITWDTIYTYPLLVFNYHYAAAAYVLKWSYFIFGKTRKGKQVIYARKETWSPEAGQTYLYTEEGKGMATDYVKPTEYYRGNVNPVKYPKGRKLNLENFEDFSKKTLLLEFNEATINEIADAAPVVEPAEPTTIPRPVKPATPQPRPQHPMQPTRPNIKPRPKAEDDNPDVELFYRLRGITYGNN